MINTLRNASGATVRLSEWGATLLGVELTAADGRVNVVLGPADAERGLPTFKAAGSVVGRFANRIARARFTLDGAEHVLPANDGPHHLHGGPLGFAHRPWALDPGRVHDGRSAGFRLVSPDGDQGYPGELEVVVTYTWSDDDELRIVYEAVTDRATPINLTHHAYLNLAGRGDVLDHTLWMDADRWLPIDRAILPTGEVASVEGTPFDFRDPRPIGWRWDELHPHPGGYDHCLVLREGRDLAAPCVRLREPRSGRMLEVVTDQPGVQLYTGNHFDDLPGASGVRFPRHGGVCLETQHFPDSVHHPEWPSVILRPGERWLSATTFRFRLQR